MLRAAGMRLYTVSATGIRLYTTHVSVVDDGHGFCGQEAIPTHCRTLPALQATSGQWGQVPQTVYASGLLTEGH
jgi:hypothetical protein